MSLTRGKPTADPDRPIELIVPEAAGGDTDAILRPLAPRLQKQRGSAVVVDNVSGASGTVGARTPARLDRGGGAP